MTLLTLSDVLSRSDELGVCTFEANWKYVEITNNFRLKNKNKKNLTKSSCNLWSFIILRSGELPSVIGSARGARVGMAGVARAPFASSSPVAKGTQCSFLGLSVQ